MKSQLEWIDHGTHEEAQLGTKDDGILFTLSHQPSYYRRGPYRLEIEMCGGKSCERWGFFDGDDQPARYYHIKSCAKIEAQAIAAVFVVDRTIRSPVPE